MTAPTILARLADADVLAIVERVAADHGVAVETLVAGGTAQSEAARDRAWCEIRNAGHLTLRVCEIARLWGLERRAVALGIERHEQRLERRRVA